MAKIKHISDGANTWDVGGGTEVFTKSVYTIAITSMVASVSGDMVSITAYAGSMTAPNGNSAPFLMSAFSYGIPAGANVEFTFSGNLPSGNISQILITDMNDDLYQIELDEAGAMKSSYITTLDTLTPLPSVFSEVSSAKTVYDALNVVSPLTVTNDGVDDCLGVDQGGFAGGLNLVGNTLNLVSNNGTVMNSVNLTGGPNKIELGKSDSDYGYDQLRILDSNNAQIGNTSYFNRLAPVIYGTWSSYDSTNECFTSISIDYEEELVQDCILVVEPYMDGCCYAKIPFDTALFGTNIVHFANDTTDPGDAYYYFTTTRKTYFRVTLTNGGSEIVLTPIENPSVKYNNIRQATDIDHVNFTAVKDSTATVNQIIGAMLAVYGWGSIQNGSSSVRAYVLQNSSGSNINPDTTITLIKGSEYVECQHFTSPVNGIFKLINSGGGRPILPIKAVSCSPYASNANLCENTSAVFYDNQTSATNRGWKLPKEASWPSSGNVSDYCYNFFIFATLQSGL